jgi:hypothetical protein
MKKFNHISLLSLLLAAVCSAIPIVPTIASSSQIYFITPQNFVPGLNVLAIIEYEESEYTPRPSNHTSVKINDNMMHIQISNTYKNSNIPSPVNTYHGSKNEDRASEDGYSSGTSDPEDGKNITLDSYANNSDGEMDRNSKKATEGKSTTENLTDKIRAKTKAK